MRKNHKENSKNTVVFVLWSDELGNRARDEFLVEEAEVDKPAQTKYTWPPSVKQGNRNAIGAA